MRTQNVSPLSPPQGGGSCARVLLLLVSLALPWTAGAEENPVRRERADSRARTVVYRDGQVVPIIVHGFQVSLVEFGDDERVLTTHVGDSESWEFDENDAGNHLFIKAKLAGVQANLIVVTNRRTYLFDLESPRGDGQRTDRVYRVRFEYPEEERARQAEARRLAQIREEALVRSSREEPPEWNTDYSYAGDKGLRPKHVYDDGESTFFRFADPNDVPAIWVVEEVDGEKRESIANYGIQGDYVVVHRVAEQFSLRSSDRLTCLFNESERPTVPDNAVNAPPAREEPSVLGRLASAVRWIVPGGAE